MPRPIGREAAEGVAVTALGLIAGDEDRLQAFFAATGLDPGDLRRAAGDPTFLRGVMEFVVADEALLVDVAAAAGLKPEAMIGAAAALGAVWERDIP